MEIEEVFDEYYRVRDCDLCTNKGVCGEYHLCKSCVVATQEYQPEEPKGVCEWSWEYSVDHKYRFEPQCKLIRGEIYREAVSYEFCPYCGKRIEVKE